MTPMWHNHCLPQGCVDKLLGARSRRGLRALTCHFCQSQAVWNLLEQILARIIMVKNRSNILVHILTGMTSVSSGQGVSHDTRAPVSWVRVANCL